MRHALRGWLHIPEGCQRGMRNAPQQCVSIATPSHDRDSPFYHPSGVGRGDSGRTLPDSPGPIYFLKMMVAALPRSENGDLGRQTVLQSERCVSGMRPLLAQRAKRLPCDRRSGTWEENISLVWRSSPCDSTWHENLVSIACTQGSPQDGCSRYNIS